MVAFLLACGCFFCQRMRRVKGASHSRGGSGTVAGDAGKWMMDMSQKCNLVVCVDADNWGGFLRNLPFWVPEGVIIAAFGRGDQAHMKDLSGEAKRLVSEGRLRFFESLTSKDAADCLMALVASEAPIGCSIILASKDMMFRQVQCSLQERRSALVFRCRTRSFLELQDIIEGLRGLPDDRIDTMEKHQQPSLSSLPPAVSGSKSEPNQPDHQRGRERGRGKRRANRRNPKRGSSKHHNHHHGDKLGSSVCVAHGPDSPGPSDQSSIRGDDEGHKGYKRSSKEDELSVVRGHSPAATPMMQWQMSAVPTVATLKRWRQDVT